MAFCTEMEDVPVTREEKPGGEVAVSVRRKKVFLVGGQCAKVKSQVCKAFTSQSTL